MARMRGAYPTPEIPRTRVSDSHTDGLVKSSVGDTFILTKSATPAMPHTWSDGPCGAKDFSTLALSPPPHDETAAEIFERLVAGNPRFKEAPKGQSLVIGGVRKPDADDVCDHRAERA